MCVNPWKAAKKGEKDDGSLVLIKFSHRQKNVCRAAFVEERGSQSSLISPRFLSLTAAAGVTQSKLKRLPIFKRKTRISCAPISTF